MKKILLQNAPVLWLVGVVLLLGAEALADKTLRYADPASYTADDPAPARL